jgi:hypothetical protein
MGSFMAHLKIKASQWYALRRIKQMEQNAAEEDEVNDAKLASGNNTESGNRRRAVNWEGRTW